MVHLTHFYILDFRRFFLKLNKKLKNITISLTFMATLTLFMVINVIDSDKAISYIERRYLNKLPQIKIKTLLDRNFSEELEKYFLDQFSFRQWFRTVKTSVELNVFRKNDTNSYFIDNSYIYKTEYPLNEESIRDSAILFNNIADKYFKNSNIYYTIIPDKNYFIQNKKYLSIDYSKLFGIMKMNTKNMDYIDISDKLTINDYYKTDLHWKQENLINIANFILESMGNGTNTTKLDYSNKEFYPFYGSYYGQAAVKLSPDKLTYLTNKNLETCKVYDYERNTYINMYSDKDFNNVDPYDIYLGGSKPLLTIENTETTQTKELFVFRDSFGSSLIPLLVNYYSKITIVDLRYISSDVFENYITPPENSDIIFMYNTLILNNSQTITNFLR